MALVIGLDIGTTKLAAVALDTATCRQLAVSTTANTARRDTVLGGLARAELDMVALDATAIALLRQLTTMLPDAAQVQAIGVTGQQHGVAFIDALGRPSALAITWQDQRALESAGPQSYLDEMVAKAGGPARFVAMGCQPAPGYLSVSLYWLARHGGLPTHASTCFIPDAVVACLVGHTTPTDPTMAGSSAFYDLAEDRWDAALLQELGLAEVQLAAVRPSGSIAGGLDVRVAQATGLTSGMPVTIALGDNQASYIGSVADPWRSVLVNIGTGGQVSALVDSFVRVEGLDTRAFPEKGYLLVGAGSSGGGTLALWHGLVQAIGAEVFGLATGDLYDSLIALAGDSPAGAAGISCVPHFGGTRTRPAETASFQGITTANLTLGNLTRALIEGIASDALEAWQLMAPIAGHRPFLVGAGNGLRRNPVLQEALATAFALPLTLTQREETAALGAALSAAVTIGAYASYTDGMRSLA